MRKVLVISYYWPPSGGSGVQRWLKFAKYLPKFGWKPIIYTPLNPDFSIKDESLLSELPKEITVLKTKIWEPYSLYRVLTGNKNKQANFGTSNVANEGSLKSKLVSWIRGNMFIPDPRVHWVNPSKKYLLNYLQSNPVDVIITTGPPHSMHLIGLALKKENPKLKWIADMRDPWSKFDLLTQFNLSNRALEKINQMEREVLRLADKVVMVSPSMYEEFNPIDQDKLEIINNGYDAEDFLESVSRSKEKKFKLFHAGLLNGIRNPEALWSALRELSSEIENFESEFSLELIGTVDITILKMIKADPHLNKLISYQGYVSHDELLDKYKEADGLLLVINKSRNAKAQIVGKVYEYLALRKPIIGLGPLNSDTAHILESTRTGSMFEISNKEGIKKGLVEMISNKKSNESMDVNKVEIEKYTRENLTKKMVCLFESLLENESIKN